MRILIMCGAGASSSFVAHRLRSAASRGGEQYQVDAGFEQSLAALTEPVDVVLVGPHLAEVSPQLLAEAERHAARVAVLPADVFTDLDGTRTLALVRELLARPAPSPTHPSEN